MKKKFIALALIIIMAVLPLSACGGGGVYTAIKVNGTQDTSYAVHSNGGNAVQYGNYLYFINGTAGYEDKEAKSNVWNKVVKGALYRAEFRGTKVGSEFTLSSTAAEVSGEFMEFISGPDKDSYDEPVDKVGVQLIAPKVIGTSGYAQGGIFIFDNYVYYATPNNEKNKAGEVQYNKTDFMRTSLDGKDTARLFTTTEDSASSPYAFYNQNGKVYLVVLDGTTLKSVVIGNKVEDVLKIAEGVTGAYLPSQADYIKGMATNSPEDFVYISREVNEDDMERTGSILEFMRPDGGERTIFLANGETSTIESVRDGLVFYRTKQNKTNNVISYTNLHDEFMGTHLDKDGKDVYNSPTYKAYEDAQQIKRISVEGVAMTIPKDVEYTFTYAFRPSYAQDKNSNAVYVLAADASSVKLFSNVSGIKSIYNGAAALTTVAENYAYFKGTGDDAFVYRINIFEFNEKAEKVSDTVVTATGLPVDICAGYVMYFAKVDEWADQYAYFKKLPGKGIEGSKAVLVAEKSEDDLKPEEDEEKN